ncbi:hypothetical protein T492DRAFT_939034, partial [Pavlovales sp. CCMP2436]
MVTNRQVILCVGGGSHLRLGVCVWQAMATNRQIFFFFSFFNGIIIFHFLLIYSCQTLILILVFYSFIGLIS